MAVTISSAENVLKSVYLNVLANQLNTNVNPLLARIKQTDAGVWGKEIIKLAPCGLNGGVGAGSETGALPTAAGNNYVQFKTTLKNLFGKIEISDKAIRASQNIAGSFVNLLNDEMEGLINASKFNLGRMLYGDGSGLLATTTGGTETTITVDDTRNLMEGMMVDIYVSDALTLAGKRITFVDRTNKTIHFANLGTTVEAGAKLYVQGSKDNEITGLEAIFGDGELYGLSRDAHPWLKPYVQSESVSIDDIMLQNAIDAIEDKGGSEIDFIACSRDVRKAYQQYLQYYRRNVDMTTLEGGAMAITFNGIPVVADKFVQNGTAYLLSTKDFALHQLGDWTWLEGDDGKVIKQNPGYPTYSATLVKYADLICDRPLGQAKITNISSTVSNPYANT